MKSDICSKRMGNGKIVSGALMALLMASSSTGALLANDTDSEAVSDVLETSESADTVLEEFNEDVGVIDEISVTATRSEQSTLKIPGSVSVISKEEIDQLIPSSISDLFVNVPSVQFVGGPRRNGEAPSIRGVSGSGVLVLFDGVRQNFLSAHDGRFFIDPSLLRSAEVVRGPNSSLYGAGAFGGVIAFETVRANDFLQDDNNFGYQLRAGFQGVNEEVLTGVNLFARSDDQRLDVVASLTYRDSTDIQLGDGNSLQSDDELASGLLKLGFQATPSLKLEGQWIAYRGESIEPNNGQALNLGDLVDKDITADTLRLGIDFKPQDQNLINLSAIGYYTESKVEESELDSDRVILRDVETTGFVIDNQSRFDINDRFTTTLTVGAEYFTDTQVGTDNATADGTRGGVPNAEAETFGAFAQLESTLDTDAGEFLLITSVRYDDFQNTSGDGTLDVNDDAVNLRVGLTWSITDWFLLYGAYGEAFRAPSFNEIFADGLHFQIPLGPFVQAPNFFVPNTELMPEESETFEFGAGFDFNGIFEEEDRFTIKGGYYTSDVTNLIDLEVNFAFSPSCFSPMIPGPCTAGTSRNTNTTSATLEGFELEAGYDSTYVFAQASVGTITGRNKETNEFVGILTPDRFNLNAGLKIPQADLRVGYRLEVNGPLNSVPSADQRRPGFERLDLYATWTPQWEPVRGLRVDVGVDNVTDSTFERVFAGVVEPGQNWKINIGWTGQF